MKKDELKARAIEILNKQNDYMEFSIKHFGENDETTKREIKKWSTMLDAYAELFEMSTCELIHECVWSD